MKVKIMESAMSQDEWREAFSRARSCFTDVVSGLVKPTFQNIFL